jgi:hypothetical protein
MSDRRKHDRIALRLLVQFVGADGSAVTSCFTRNISSGGFYFVSPEPLVPGDEKEVFLDLPACSQSRSGTNAGISCQVRVVRVDSMGAGLGFGVACQIDRYTVAASERTSLAWRNYA